MKTLAFVKCAWTAGDIIARVNKIAPRFLEGLAPDDLGVILGAATLQRYRAHTIIANEGDSADRLFLLLEGRARTFTTTRRGERVLLLRVLEGDGAGGRALLSKPMEYLVSTETMVDSCMLMWPRSVILPLTKQYPILLENALLIASDYIEAYRDMHVAASHHTASQRVARVLDSLAKEIGQPVTEGTELKVNNEELAHEANVTIFTVSRLLSEWQRKGLLMKGRGRVILCSPEALVRCAS